MFIDMLKGFLVGICASAPIGPIAILVVQKSLSMGFRSWSERSGYLLCVHSYLRPCLRAEIP